MASIGRERPQTQTAQAFTYHGPWYVRWSSLM